MFVSPSRLLPLLLGLLAGSALLLSPAGATTPARASAAADGRLIVLGFDGGDARTTRELIEAGGLPNLRKLSETGTFAPLTPTASAESPVSWASLNSGQNPAKTGVPGFVRRHLSSSKTPFPFFGHLELDVATPVEELQDAPVPTWSPMKLGGILGGAVFLFFAIVLALLLKLRAVTAVVLSLVLGGVAFAGGMYWRGLLPSSMPRVANVLKVAPFWEVAGQAGISSIVLDAAQAWDREPVENVRLLAGLGVPDARGGVQSFFIYTTDELWPHEPPHTSNSDTGSGGDKFRVYEQDGKIQSLVYGPKNHYEIDRLQQEMDALTAKMKDADPRKRAELNDALAEIKTKLTAANGEEGRLTADLVVERQGDQVAVTLGTETQVLSEGEWSDWYHLTFDLNPVVKVKAITRAKVLSMDEPFELYVNSLEIDPAAPPFWQPISQPHGFSAELESEIGPYETIGWACMTMPFKDEIVDPVTFMEDIEFTMRWREKMLHAALARDDWRLLFSVLSTPDRVQHMMYQFYDTQHPMYDAEKAGREMTFFGETITLQDAIPAIYRQIDRVVGEVVDQYLQPDDTLMICADHGFQSFRRGVNINNWLHENGYLAVKSNLRSKRDGRGLGFVDWSKTQVYALGLGMLYVNQLGREGQGIVPEDEVDALLTRLRSDFIASVDPETGLSIGKDARIMRQIQQGPYDDLSPDMMLGFDVGYRVSWGTTTGGMRLTRQDDGSYAPGDVYEDSNKNWSGDHVSVDPTLVQGMFFSNRKVEIPAEGIHVMHIAPTALEVLGVPVPPVFDKQPLKFQ